MFAWGNSHTFFIGAASRLGQPDAVERRPVLLRLLPNCWNPFELLGVKIGRLLLGQSTG